MTLQCLIPGPFAAETITVRWQSREPARPPHVEEFLSARWGHYLQDAQARGARLFNGPISYLQNYAAADGRLLLELAPSDYRSFLVSCLRDASWFDRHACAQRRPALGNSALLTADSTALLGLRAPGLAAYPGRGHLFGGVLDALGTPALPASADGLVAHLRLELSEELGLTPADLAGPPRALGLYFDPFLHQPELVWHWPLAADPRALAARLDGAEHDRLLLVPRAGPLPEVALTPLAEAALAAWRSL